MAPWTRNRPSTDSGAPMAAPGAVPATNVPGDGYNGKHAAAAERPRFRLGTWLRLHGVDLLTMAAMGAVGLGVYEARQ